jgi:hypothetical protein
MEMGSSGGRKAPCTLGVRRGREGCPGVLGGCTEGFRDIFFESYQISYVSKNNATGTDWPQNPG